LVIAGAYEPPKAAKERATPVYAWVPLKYKFKQKLSIFGNSGADLGILEW
jgi:hypothetical protein